MVGHVLRGFRCRALLGSNTRLPPATATNIVVIGYACNNVLPARLGELVRSGMLSERAGVSYDEALTITIIERMLDGLAIVVLLMTTSLVMPLDGWIYQLARASW